jgi:hypothetical protein
MRGYHRIIEAASADLAVDERITLATSSSAHCCNCNGTIRPQHRLITMGHATSGHDRRNAPCASAGIEPAIRGLGTCWNRPDPISTDDPGPIATRQFLAKSVAEASLARSTERAVDDHLAQGALEDRELLIIELRDEQLRDTARMGRRGLC